MILAQRLVLGQIVGSFLTQAQALENKREKGLVGGFWVNFLQTQTEAVQHGEHAPVILYSLHNIFTF